MELRNTGERQIGRVPEEIANDHFKRYEFAAQECAKIQPRVIYDLGCGVGYGANVMAQHGCKVVAYDCSETALEFARENWFHPDVRFYCHNINDLAALPENITVVAFEIIEHLPEPDKFLHSAASAGNVLFVSVPNQEGQPFSKDAFPFHYRHYTASELERLLNDTGWNVTSWYHQKDKWEGSMYSGRNSESRTIIVRAESCG